MWFVFSRVVTDDFLAEASRGNPVRRRLQLGAVMCVAVAAELGPWPAAALSFKPDFPALTLVYWGIHAPGATGMLSVLATGLLMDLARHTPLGFNILCYATVMLLVGWLRGRFVLLGAFGRGFHVFLILCAGQLTAHLLMLIQNPEAPLGWRHFLPAAAGGFLWLALPLAARRIRKLLSRGDPLTG